MKLSLTLVSIFFALSAFCQDNTHEYHMMPLDNMDVTAIINAVESQPEDANAHFDLAALYYNQGVSMIDNMTDDLTYDQVKALQAQVMVLFEKALPSALKSHKLDPERRETVRMISGIYFGLNDLEKAELFENKLKKK